MGHSQPYHPIPLSRNNWTLLLIIIYIVSSDSGLGYLHVNCSILPPSYWDQTNTTLWLSSLYLVLLPVLWPIGVITDYFVSICIGSCQLRCQRTFSHFWRWTASAWGNLVALSPGWNVPVINDKQFLDCVELPFKIGLLMHTHLKSTNMKYFFWVFYLLGKF